MNKRNDILENEKEIRKWIYDLEPKAYICRMLKCRPGTLDRYLLKMSIKYSGNQGRKKRERHKNHVSYHLKKNGSFITSHHLKLLLIRDGLKKHQCEKCKLKKWLKKSIPLELHHVNGDREDNRLKNLKLICPNCHSLTPNNSGKANKRVPG
jgi:Zn finger protein HypA/HybF involved in hydrogenase expression